MPPIRAALFVDFDQVFGALHRIRPEAAIAFATQPGRWLEFFENGMHVEQNDMDGLIPRSLLVRRCYLNPVGALRAPQDHGHGAIRHRTEQRDVFGNYRVHFTRAAFSVIDCPPLTSQGKNSADIVMVMDILDILNHHAHVDEFIILSSDADFTPVLLKLRMHDRRTTILADQVTAAAYRNACDYQVQQADFIEQAIGLEAESSVPRVVSHAEHDMSYMTGQTAILDKVAQAVAGYLRAKGPLQVSGLNPVFRMFPEFSASTVSGRWFGHGSLNRLVVELARRNQDIKLDQSDASNVIAFVDGGTIPSQAAQTPYRQQGLLPNDGELREQALSVVRNALSEASEPVGLAHLAQKVLREVPEMEGSSWLGAGQFGAFLRFANDPHIALLSRHPGYAYDPSRHSVRQNISSASNRLSGLPEPLRTLAIQIAQVSNCPALMPHEFHAIFVALATELARLSVAEDQNWGQQYLAACVYERCAEQMLPITQENVTFVLTALEKEDSNWRSDEGYHDPQRLSEAFCNNVDRLCENAGKRLTDNEWHLLGEWICNDGQSVGEGTEPSLEDIESADGSGHGAVS